MTDASAPKVTRRTLLDGHGRRRRRRRRRGGWAWATTGSAAGSRVSRSLGKKVIVIGVDGMDPRLSREHDEGGPAAEPREAPGRRRLQHAGHQHAAAEPRRLGQLHQRRRAGLARDLRLHPPPSRRTSATRSTRPPRPCPARGTGTSATTGSSSTSGRSTTSRPRPCSAPGDAVLGLPRRRGRPLDVLRPAVQLPGQPVAPRPPPLPLRHGHARHAGHLRHLPVLRRGRARPSRSTKAAASGRG